MAGRIDGEAVAAALAHGINQAIDRRVQRFAPRLQAWLGPMLNLPPSGAWREELAAFLRRTADEDKLEITPWSAASLAALIEARAGFARRSGSSFPVSRAPRPALREPTAAAVGAPEADGHLVRLEAAVEPGNRQTAAGGHRLGQSHFSNGQQLFDDRLASARQHLAVLQQLLIVAGEKIDKAKLDEKTDLGYETLMAGKHLRLYNDDLIAAREIWLRYNLPPAALEKLFGMSTPVTIGLPACADPGQESRQRQQSAEIRRRLAGEIAALDAQANVLSAVDVAANAASLVVGAGVLVGVARKGGTWAVVKTVTVGYAIYMDTKIAEVVAQDAGVSDQTIRGVELAAAVITLILLHKVPAEPIPESPPAKPAARAPAEPGMASPALESPAPSAVPRLRATTAKDAINEITEIVARTSGDGATKAAKLKALLEQAARQGIKGRDGAPIGFEAVRGNDGSTIFLGGFELGGARRAIVISPEGGVYSGRSSLTGKAGVKHHQGNRMFEGVLA